MLFSRDSLQGPKVEPKKALILIDFQHDFTSADGNLFVRSTDVVLKKLPNLISKFRETSLIVWAKTTFTEPCPSLSPQIGGYQVICRDLAQHMRQHMIEEESRFGRNSDLARSPPRRTGRPRLSDDDDAFLGIHIPSAKRCCLNDTAGHDLSTELRSYYDVNRDLMINKSQYSALADFVVVNQLRARMVNHLYICGSLSNVGVYATVLDAVQQGFTVTLVEDCLGYREEVCHLEAMRRMADDLGANGIDCEELLDDLYGLLGDVIPATRYTRNFQLSMQRSTPQSSPSSSQRVSQWMQTVDAGKPQDSLSLEAEKKRHDSQVLESNTDPTSITALSGHDSSTQPEIMPSSLKHTPSRKRSTSERDESIKASVQTKDPVTIPPDPEPPRDDTEHRKVIKKSRTNPSSTSPSSSQPLSSHNYIADASSPRLPNQSRSETHIATIQKAKDTSATADRTMSQPNLSATNPSKKPAVLKQKQQKLNIEASYLGPDSIIGAGDSKVIYDVLSTATASESFDRLKREVAWQKMLHRTGEVPRLVAVQGIIAADGSIPIYRHPADESPPLLPFDETVDSLRQACEGLVGHKLNHVLIQHYRTSEDNISEHSDKTLDIVRGSTIVNLSLGAMRTMTLRSKKIPAQTVISEAGGSIGAKGIAPPRPAQRIRLPHNSLFVLGERTNANWLHAIRADKRPVVEKSEDELAFNGERISLTFRHIGTFIDPERQLIWGQGATSKDRGEARTILKGTEAESTGEEMIIGFGKENHLTDAEYSWDDVYGVGFDVVNFEVKTKES